MSSVNYLVLIDIPYEPYNVDVNSEEEVSQLIKTYGADNIEIVENPKYINAYTWSD